jgi:hypothetical protein
MYRKIKNIGSVASKILAGRIEGKKPLARPRRRYVGNFKV